MPGQTTVMDVFVRWYGVIAEVTDVTSAVLL